MESNGHLASERHQTTSCSVSRPPLAFSCSGHSSPSRAERWREQPPRPGLNSGSLGNLGRGQRCLQRGELYLCQCPVPYLRAGPFSPSIALVSPLYWFSCVLSVPTYTPSLPSPLSFHAPSLPPYPLYLLSPTSSHVPAVTPSLVYLQYTPSSRVPSVLTLPL